MPPATLIRSRNAPAEGFDSPSVELIDMNGDGLPDQLSTQGVSTASTSTVGSMPAVA
jgi:hypothetical protein